MFSTRNPQPATRSPGVARIALLLAAAIVLLAAALALLGMPASSLARGWLRQDQARGVWVRAERVPFGAEVAELGAIAARSETFVLSGFTGDIVWMIEEGTFVQAGTVIVRFNSTATEDELEQLRKTLLDKEEAVRAAEREAEAVRRKGELGIARMKAGLELARLDRQDTYSRPLPDERREAALTLEAARLRLASAQRDFEAYSELRQCGYASEAVLRQKRLLLATQKAEHAKARMLYDLALQGATADAKRLVDLAVAEADKKVGTAQVNHEADVAMALASLELSRVELANTQLTVREKERMVEAAEAKAPVAGRVAFVDVYKGSRAGMGPIVVGEVRTRGQELCKIVDPSTLRVNIRVSEAEVGRVKEGQRADVRLTALPGRVFKARVAEIARVARDKNAALSGLALRHAGQAFVKVIGVYLDFEALSPSDQTLLRPGLSASVRVQADPVAEAVVIPWGAVTFAPDGQAWAEVGATTGQTTRRALKLGRSSALQVEVREGLQVGEQVFVGGRVN